MTPQNFGPPIIFQHLIENAPIFVWISEDDIGCTYANKKFIDFVGGSYEKLHGRNYLNCLHPDDLPIIEQLQTKLKAKPQEFEVTVRFQKANGEYRHINFKGVRRTLDGHSGFFGFGFDITEEIQAKHALQESELKANTIAESNIIGVCGFNLDGRIEYANQALLDMLGYSRDEFNAGQLRWDNLTPPESKQIDQLALESLRTTGKTGQHEKEFFRRDGSRFPVLTAGTMYPNSKTRGVGFIVDISKMKEVESQLNAAVTKAEAADKMKSDFLAYVSHEIRTPLSAILGISDLMVHSAVKAEQKKSLELLHESANSMMRILNDVLDLSKMEAGKLTLESTPFYVRDLVSDIAQIFLAKAKMKGLELKALVDAHTSEILVGDPFRIRQILMNLIGNSIKFTNEGGIIVRVEAQRDIDPDTQLIRFSVEDSGIGMDSEEMERVFEPFVGFEKGEDADARSTGLGLSISKRLAESMGGKMSLRSRVGEGSTFSFELQLPRMSAQIPKTPLPLNKRPQRESRVKTLVPLKIHSSTARVLVVDDDPINREVISRQLKRLGLSAAVAVNGCEAITAVANGRYDLVLMDCQMPLMDGYRAAEKLREIQPGILIIGLTAVSTDEQLEHCLKSGMSDCLTKPLQLDTLHSKVLYWLNEQSGAQDVIDQDLIELFLNSSDLRLKSMLKSFHEGNWSSIAKTAHAMISSTSTMKQVRMQSICRLLEHRALNENPKGIEACLKMLEDKMEHLLPKPHSITSEEKSTSRRPEIQ